MSGKNLPFSQLSDKLEKKKEGIIKVGYCKIKASQTIT